MEGYNLLPSIDEEGSNHQSVGQVLIFIFLIREVALHN